MARFKGGRNRNDTFTGTDKSDTFLFDPAELTGGDTIVGGGGLDTLVFTAPGVVAASAFANVSGIERIELSDGGNRIMLTRELLFTTRRGVLLVDGGAGDDVIDASGIVGDSTFASLLVSGGAGDDVIIGVTGNGNSGRISQQVDGGAGRDTIDLTGAPPLSFRVFYDPDDIRVAISTSSSSSSMLIVSGAATIDLTRADDQSLRDRAVVTGFNVVDARTSSVAVRLTGGSDDDLYGGSGDDVLRGGGRLLGGAGVDTMIGIADWNAFPVFDIREGDFAAGEKILGRGANDTLYVTGSADFRTGTVKGIERISAFVSDAPVSTVTLNTSQMSSGMYSGVLAEADSRHTTKVELYLDKGHQFTAGNGYSGDITLHATGAADTISVGNIAVYAGGGDDVVSGSDNIDAGAGDDTVMIAANGLARVVDGGTGRDTIRLTSNTYSVHIDLRAGDDQLLANVAVVRNFENVDLSAASVTGSSTITGSAKANHIVGSNSEDVIVGGQGDDILDGWMGWDTLTGGGGADTFHWSQTGSYPSRSTITDFSLDEDRLEFDRLLFRVPGGTLDIRVITDQVPTDLRGIDLVTYTGRSVNDASAAARLFGGARHDVGEGAFIAATNDAGHAVLFYLPVGFSNGVAQIAEFTNGITALDLDLSMLNLV